MNKKTFVFLYYLLTINTLAFCMNRNESIQKELTTICQDLIVAQIDYQRTSENIKIFLSAIQTAPSLDKKIQLQAIMDEHFLLLNLTLEKQNRLLQRSKSLITEFDRENPPK